MSSLFPSHNLPMSAFIGANPLKHAFGLQCVQMLPNHGIIDLKLTRNIMAGYQWVPPDQIQNHSLFGGNFLASLLTTILRLRIMKYRHKTGPGFLICRLGQSPLLTPLNDLACPRSNIFSIFDPEKRLGNKRIARN